MDLSQSVNNFFLRELFIEVSSWTYGYNINTSVFLRDLIDYAQVLSHSKLLFPFKSPRSRFPL